MCTVDPAGSVGAMWTIGRNHWNTHSKMVVGSTSHTVSLREVPSNGKAPSPPPVNVPVTKVLDSNGQGAVTGAQP